MVGLGAAFAALGSANLAATESPTLTGLRHAGAFETPTIIAITRGHSGGEARFEGELRIENGCVVAVSGAFLAIPLFDKQTAIGENGRSLVERSDLEVVQFGQRFEASTAHLRNNGTGWSVGSIEDFYGVTIPAACPTRNIIRLRRLISIKEGKQ